MYLYLNFKSYNVYTSNNVVCIVHGLYDGYIMLSIEKNSQ